MNRTSLLSLKKVLTSVLSGRPERRAVERLIIDSHRIALAYLQQKVRRGNLQPHLFGISLEDLALDCFAELFQRDEHGCFEQIRNYFETFFWQAMNEEELRIALRRLIFTKVNEGLFRRYHEVDPNLAKIIRNVKDTVKAHPLLSLARDRERLWMVAGPAGTSVNPLPCAPFEVLEAYLVTSLCRNPQFSQAVSAFVNFASEHPHYSNAHPVSGFAQALQAAFKHTGDALYSEQEGTPFLESEVKKAISIATGSVRSHMYAVYVGPKKVDVSTFEAYFRAVRDILATRFVSGLVPATSYREALGLYIPNLSKTLYQQRHRHILEYLVKLSQARLIDYLRDEP